MTKRLAYSQRLVGAYLVKEKYIIQSYGSTDQGMYIAEQPAILLNVSGTSELGSAVFTALAEWRPHVPHPTEWRGRKNPAVVASGLGSWSKLATQAVYVAILFNDTCEFQPHRSLGAVDGFVPIVDKAFVGRISTNEEMGEQLLRAFSACVRGVF